MPDNCNTILNLSFDAVCILSPDGEIITSNSAMAELIECSIRDLPGKHFSDMFENFNFQNILQEIDEHGISFSRADLRLQENAVVHVMLNASYNENKEHVLAVIRPASTLKGHNRSDQLAFHDALTGLPNRVILDDRIKAAVELAISEGVYTAVVFIDLDEFKPINDTYGHECGDHVLIKVAERLLYSIREADTAARIGGDEFVVVLSHIKVGVHAGLTAKRIIREITQPVLWEGIEVAVSASVGISVAPTNAHDPEGLLRKADEAMYMAKKSGKNGYAFFDESGYYS